MPRAFFEVFMDFALLIPDWLDAFLIAPFRWPPSPYAGLYLGSACLAFYCTVLGELSSACIFLLHHRYYHSMQDTLVHYHNLSVDALHSGDKNAYIAANTMAQEHLGKSFFAQGAIGMAGLWPLPFALGWMALRFEGITLFRIPGTNAEGGYVFVLFTVYILCRILFSRCIKPRIPLFRHIARCKQEAQKARGAAKSFFPPLAGVSAKPQNPPPLYKKNSPPEDKPNIS